MLSENYGELQFGNRVIKRQSCGIFSILTIAILLNVFLLTYLLASNTPYHVISQVVKSNKA